MTLFDIDFRRTPYKGIMGEVAKEMGVTTPSVRNGFARKSPKYVKAIRDKVEAVHREIYSDLEDVPGMKEAV